MNVCVSSFPIHYYLCKLVVFSFLLLVETSFFLFIFTFNKNKQICKPDLAIKLSAQFTRLFSESI